MGGALLIGSAICVVVIARYVTRISPVALFWIAFVLTRPFGATQGDFPSRMKRAGWIPPVGSSAVLGGVLLVMVGMAYYFNNRRTRQAELVRIS